MRPEPETDDDVQLVYRDMPTPMLRRAAEAFLLDQAEAYRGGPDREAFIQRRLRVIRRLLEGRGEVMPRGGGRLF